MEIVPAVGDAARLKTEFLVLGVFSSGALTGSARAVDDLTEGRLSLVMERGELGAAAGATLLLPHLPGSFAARILLVSLGKAETYCDRAYWKALAATGRVLVQNATTEAVVALAEIDVPGRTLSWRVQQAGHVIAAGSSAFALPDVQPSSPKARRRPLSQIMLLIPQTLTSELVAALRQGVAVAEGVALARNLGNLPPRICTPAFLASTAKAMGEEFGFSVEVLERPATAKPGSKTFASGKGRSGKPCKLIVMRCNGRRVKSRPIVLVGKGINVDDGVGLSGSRAHPDALTFDMRGAGSVLGAMRTVARLGLPINVIGLIATAEGTPRQQAAIAGDHVASLLRQATETLSDDAEGWLLLGDALTYAGHFHPACVIDVATLTEACVVALGSHASGLFANDDALAAELLKCGAVSGDRAWQLPLSDEDPEQIDSDFADLSHLGPCAVDAITAASVLARFARAYPWAHIDIAGTASISRDTTVSTGRPVPLLAEFLIRRAAEAA
jgi:leucyl aminopeptidase